MASVLLPDADTFLKVRAARHAAMQPPTSERRHLSPGEVTNLALVAGNLLGKTADFATQGIGELHRRSQESDAIDNRAREIVQARMGNQQTRDVQGQELQQRGEDMIAHGGRTPLSFDAAGRPSEQTAQDIAYPSNETLAGAQREPHPELLALRAQMGDASRNLSAMGLGDTTPPGPAQAAPPQPPMAQVPQLPPDNGIPQQIDQQGPEPRSVMRQLPNNESDNLDRNAPRPLRTLAQLRMAALAAGMGNDAGEKRRVLEDLGALGGGAYAPTSFEEALSGGGQNRTISEFAHTLNPPHSLSPEQLALMMARTENAQARTTGQKAKNEIIDETGLDTAKAKLAATQAGTELATGTQEAKIGKAKSDAEIATNKSLHTEDEFKRKGKLTDSQVLANNAKALRDKWSSVGIGGQSTVNKNNAQASASRSQAGLNSAKKDTIRTGNTFEGRLQELRLTDAQQRTELLKNKLEKEVKTGKMEPLVMQSLLHLQKLTEGDDSDVAMPESQAELEAAHPGMDMEQISKLMAENAHSNEKRGAMQQKRAKDLASAHEQAIAILKDHPEWVDRFAPYFLINIMDPLNP